MDVACLLNLLGFYSTMLVDGECLAPHRAPHSFGCTHLGKLLVTPS
jgi:hypothetical protein